MSDSTDKVKILEQFVKDKNPSSDVTIRLIHIAMLIEAGRIPLDSDVSAEAFELLGSYCRLIVGLKKP
jgi:hypothetical protein